MYQGSHNILKGCHVCLLSKGNIILYHDVRFQMYQVLIHTDIKTHTFQDKLFNTNTPIREQTGDRYTLVQKKRESFTCSFLALTYWLNLNLMSILKRFSLFSTKPCFCFYCATHNKQMDEISKFQVEIKKSQKCTHVQKKRVSFTCWILALPYWFLLNLIFKKFRLFPTKQSFCFYCATHNSLMVEISEFQVEK